MADGRTWRDYFIGELLNIRSRSGKIEPLIPNRVQKEYSRLAATRNIVLKARQMGMTTWIAAGFFIDTIAKPGTTTLLVAHEMRAAQDLFEIVNRFWRRLDSDGNLMKGRLRRSRANVREMVFPKIESEYRVDTAWDPEVGRGLTIQNLHCSEVARWPETSDVQPHTTLAALRAAVVPGGKIVLESTPNGTAGAFYEEWTRATETKYKQHFFPWWWEDVYVSDAPVDEETLTADERALLGKGLNLRQIAFRRELQLSYRGLAPQEFAEDANTCFLASGNCLFDAEMIENRIKEYERPQSTVRNLTTFLEPQANLKYVIGVDPSGGSRGGDYACAQVIDLDKGRQCAELHGYLRPSVLAQRVAQLGLQYNTALVAVERNNHGHQVLEALSRIEHYSNLYEDRGQLGFLMTSVTKPLVIARLGAIFASCTRLFKSEGLLKEMLSFVNHRNGRQAAGAGAYDDRVMAMGIALAVREEMAGKR